MSTPQFRLSISMAAALAGLAGCSDDSGADPDDAAGGGDVAADVAADAAVDSGLDAPADVPTDTPADLDVDVVPDVTADAADAPADITPADVTPDLPADVAPDGDGDASDGGASDAGDSGSAFDADWPDGPTSTVQLVHMAAAPPLDVYLRGLPEALAAELPFGDATGHLAVPLTDAPIDFTLGGTVDVIAEAVPPFGYHTDEVWTGGVVGEEGDFRALIFRENARPAPEGVRWRVVNGLPGASATVYFDDLISTPVAFYEDIAFGGRSPDMPVAASRYQIGVDVDDDEAIDYRFDLGELLVGEQVTMWLGRSADGEVRLTLVFRDGGWRVVTPAAG